MFYSKWESKDSIIKELSKLDGNTAGIPVVENDGVSYGINNRNHNMVISCDAKESRESIILPFIDSIITAEKSFLINDVSGKIYESISDRLSDYTKILIDFKDLKNSNSFNPLQVPYILYKDNKDKALKVLEDVGYYLLNDGKIKNDPYWENTAIDYFCGLTMYLFQNKGLVSIKDVFDLSIDILKNNKKDEFMNNINPKSDIYAYLVGTMDTAPETYKSILSVFNQMIKKYVVGDIADKLSTSTVSLTDIVNKKCAIFIINGVDECSSHLVPLIVSELSLVCEIYKNSKKFEIILDDFDSLIAVRDFPRLIKYSTVTDIKYTVIVSGYKTIINKYGKDEFALLELCFSNVIYLLSNDISTLKAISDYCGNSSDDTKLISTTELKHLKNNEVIILIPRYYPFKTVLK